MTLTSLNASFPAHVFLFKIVRKPGFSSFLSLFDVPVKRMLVQSQVSLFAKCSQTEESGKA